MLRNNLFGLKTNKISILNQSTFVIRMESEVSLIDKAVVINFNTRRKGDNNIFISFVDAKDINIISQVCVDELLQGKLSGIYVN